MSVAPVGGSAPAASPEPDVEAAIGEALGVLAYQFCMGLVAQGALLNTTVTQAFGEENQMEKAKNIDIA